LRHHYPGEVLRLTLIMSHYRQPMDWSDAQVKQAKQTLDRLYNALRGLNLTEDIPYAPDQILMDALQDDLNLPLAICRLHDLANQVYKTTDLTQKTVIGRLLKSSADFLGLLQQDPESWFQSTADSPLDIAAIEQQIAARQQARVNRQFAESDRIRQELLDQGIILEDSATGTTWRRADLCG